MSAFPESGRSDRKKLGEIKVRFRPKAVVRDDLGSSQHSLFRPTHQDSAPDFNSRALDVRIEFPILRAEFLHLIG